jgi:hypothetical protein
VGSGVRIDAAARDWSRVGTLGLVDLSARCPSGPQSFKRRLLTVDRFGEIAVARIDSRGQKATRYAH